MAGIVASSSPSSGVSAGGHLTASAIEADRKALETRRTKMLLASSPPSVATADVPSKDPAFYSLYLKDVHAVLTQMLHSAATRMGQRDIDWIHKTLSPAVFDSSFFARVEDVRSKSISEGGLGRGVSSGAQISFNKLVFEVIKEQMTKINELSGLEYTPGVVPAVGLKREEYCVSSCNFVSKIERRMLEALFPERPLEESDEDYVDRIARESVSIDVNRFYHKVDMIAKDPIYNSALVPFFKPYSDKLREAEAVIDGETSDAAEARKNRLKLEATQISKAAAAAADRLIDLEQMLLVTADRISELKSRGQAADFTLVPHSKLMEHSECRDAMLPFLESYLKHLKEASKLIPGEPRAVSVARRNTSKREAASIAVASYRAGAEILAIRAREEALATKAGLSAGGGAFVPPGQVAKKISIDESPVAGCGVIVEGKSPASDGSCAAVAEGADT